MRLLLYILLLASLAAGVAWLTHRANGSPPANLAGANSVDANRALDTAVIVVDELMLSMPDQARKTTLPHYWAADSKRTQAKDDRVTQTYFLNIDLKVPRDELWSIFIPQVLHSAEITLNGNPIGRRLEAPLYNRAGLRSLLVPLPRGALIYGKNSLTVSVTAKPARKAMLGKLYIGPAAELQPWHDSRVFQHQLLWFVATALFLIGSIAFVLGLSSDNDPVYSWFAAMCFAWLIARGAALLTRAPIDWQWVELVGSLGRIGFICIAYLFCLNFIDQAGRTITRVILTLGVITLAMYSATALMGLSTTLHLQISIGALQATGLVVAYRFYRRAWQNPEGDIVPLATGGTLILGFGVYDTFAGFTTTPPTFRYLNYLSPMLFIIAGYVLLRRFSAALKRAELQTLASVPAVASDRQRLGSTTTSANRILLAERERIMRDMHDGVGGHLVSSLSILRNHQISDPDLEEALSQALVDLRLMIDSLEETDGDLSVAVAMLKDRTQRALKDSTTETNWRIDEIVLPSRGPADTLQILRIIQESISNVLKHAGADELAVSARMADKKLAHFCIHDDGQGFDVERAKTGRGLMNLRKRAEALGAELEISSSVSGTRIDLWVPDQPNLDTGKDSS